MRNVVLWLVSIFSLLMGLQLAISVKASQAADTSLYDQQIYAPVKMTVRLKAAVEDLKTYLSRITGKEFSVTDQRDDAGIILALESEEGVPAQAVKLLPSGASESLTIWPEGNQRLWLVSKSEMGLSHAIYLYLEKLGCRWYFPSESWTFVPSLTDIRLDQPIPLRPAYRSRAFAGTGGFGGNLPLDPTRSLQHRWEDWERRNRFGGEFRISGHTGEAFNVKYKAELEAHPEWLAMIDGKRVPWSQIAKLCVGNPEVVDLYVKERLEIYRNLIKHYPNQPISWGVSVEPADGGAHCTAPESLAIGSVSDRVFYVANQVAKAVKKEIPGGNVTLFAYNEHAAVPNIPLEDNVYVQVIPYAFQRTGLSPDQLLDAWSQKVKQMGVYDYWSIPDWSHDLPDFDPLVFGPERLRSWNRRGVDSFLCESTYSSGAMGLAWYLGSRVAWNPETDVDALLNSFLADCFGPASPPMRKMLERWSQGFYLTSHELALSYQDIQSAAQLAKGNADVLTRIADYGRFVEYLRLRFEYLQSKRGTPERVAAADRLMKYLWSIYDSTMIHAFRHSQLLARDESNAGNKTLLEAFNWQQKEAPGWATIQPLTDQQILARVQQGVKNMQPQAFTARRFSGELTPLNTVTQDASAEAFGPEMVMNNSLEMTLLAKKAGEKFLAQLGSEQPVRFAVTDPNGKKIIDQELSGKPDWKEQWTDATFTAKVPGLYHLNIVSQKRTFRIQVPTGVKLTMPGWSNSQGWPSPKVYFYVPAGTEQLAIYANYVAAGPPRFFDSEGSEVQPKLVDLGHLMILPVSTEQRGKVWSLDRAKCPIGPMQMLNAPNQFSFVPQSLLVPKDAIGK